MKRLFTFLLIISSAITLVAQDPCSGLNYHAFKAENIAGEYIDLDTLGSQIEMSQWDDANSEPQEIGFTFEYQCQEFTQFIMSTNGFIKLGNEPLSGTHIFFRNAQSTQGGVFESDTVADINLIVAFNHDLDAGTETPEHRVYTSGSAPNRVCTVQWKNIREWTSDPPKQYDNIDFQIKLYETTNVIEFVYGDWMPSANTSNFKTGAAGLKGAGNEDDQLLVVVKYAAATWDNVIFKNGDYAPNESFNFGRPPEGPKPDIGRTYRFTPTYENDLTVREVYALGDASLFYSSPQRISANILNSAFNSQINIPVILNVTGSNTFTDTQYIAALAFGENKTITFSEFVPASNGVTNISVSLPVDESNADNSITRAQNTNDFVLSYSTQDGPARGWGFPSGSQGVYYVKYPVQGTARVNAVNVYLEEDEDAVNKTVFGVVLNAAGELVARSEDYVIHQDGLVGWHSFLLPVPPVFTDTEFYAGLAMASSLTEYMPLGVQEEDPIHPGRYYKSLITGDGLTEMDPYDFSFRFMIGATLDGIEPGAGKAHRNTSICVSDTAHLYLEGHTGFIQWQESPNGFSPWANVSSGMGSATENYITPPLTTTTYYRAEVSQPGFAAVVSNVVFVVVFPEVPVITQSGDTLMSSSFFGNQWYDQDGPIPGATDPLFIVPGVGDYYVIVTDGECTSLQSNIISVIGTGTKETDLSSLIKVYPNPVGDAMWLEVKGDLGPIEFEILDLVGNIVYEGKLFEKIAVDMKRILPGKYFIRLKRSEFVELKSVIKK